MRPSLHLSAIWHRPIAFHVHDASLLLLNFTPFANHKSGTVPEARAVFTGSVTMPLQPDSACARRRAEDASVEIAICQLLLGHRAEALSTLGVPPGAAASDDSSADDSILDFIQVCCPVAFAKFAGGIHMRHLIEGGAMCSLGMFEYSGHLATSQPMT